MTWECSAPGCGQDAVLQWERYATQAEYELVAASQHNPNDGVVRKAVFACGNHAFGGDAADAATFAHQAECAWPEVCHCPADSDPPTYITSEAGSG
jgi:hypothetical protein